MGRLDGIGEALGALLALLGLSPSPFVLAMAGLLVALAALPFFLKVERQRKLRKLVAAAAEAPAADRAAARQAALAAASSPVHWIVLAEEAHRRRVPKLAQAALAGLRATGRRRTDVRRLERRIEKRVPTTAEGEAAAIERLLEAGLWEEAERRLSNALQQFPRSESLADLAEQHASAGGSTDSTG